MSGRNMKSKSCGDLTDDQQEERLIVESHAKSSIVVNNCYTEQLIRHSLSTETIEFTDGQFCRICHSCGEEELIAPCKCAGSTEHVHASCLVKWFKKSVRNRCELCQHEVIIEKKKKHLKEWRRPKGKPIPCIWFLVFLFGFLLNMISIYVNASEHCKSTACVIFYVVNGFGIVLDAAFLYFWLTKCIVYWKKWIASNETWHVVEFQDSLTPLISVV